MLGEKPPRRRTRPVIKDVRIFGNTINHAIQTLKKTGIDAQTFRSETEEYLEWVVPYSQSGGAGTKACLNVDYKIPFPYHFPQSFSKGGPRPTAGLFLSAA